MQDIHKIMKVTNNQVIIDLPPDFAGDEVEVILKPLPKKHADIYEIEKEIDIGKSSPLSPRSHEEIFADLRKKYESG